LKASVLVVGSGVSGLSTALALLRLGHAVTLLDRGEVGSESSWAGGGIVSPLLPWDYAEPFSRLALRSMASYAGWVEDIEAQSDCIAEFWQCGMAVLEADKPDAALAWCRAHGLTAHSGDHAVWLPEIAQVRNPRLVAALREATLKLGATILTQCAAENVYSRSGKLTAVSTSQGVFKADRFVIATGAWSGVALPGMEGVPNVRPIRGQMLLFKLDPGALDRILYRKGLYLIPRRDGHLLVGSTLEDAGFDKSTDAATHQRLHAEAADLLPELAAVQPIRHWAGLRPGSPENLPIIDRHPDFENVFVNAGHYRYGVTLAPASAELLVDLMEGVTPALDPAPYGWQAALERTWTEPL
jgi:glycine oxidase